jgi:hypothetical protein
MIRVQSAAGPSPAAGLNATSFEVVRSDPGVEGVFDFNICQTRCHWQFTEPQLTHRFWKSML